MKIAKLVVTSVALTLALSSTALAGTWRQGENRPDAWWYDYGDGRYPSNTWVWLNDDRDGIAKCYYFGEGGWLLTNAIIPDGYQVNADGQQITYDRIRRVYSTAAVREAVRTANDKTYRPKEAIRNHGKDDNFDEDTGRRADGPEFPFMQQAF